MTKAKDDHETQPAGDAPAMKPFANSDAAVTVGGLSIESDEDRVSISGSLDIKKDGAGLEQAKVLRNVLDAIVSALESETDLPERAEKGETKPTKRVRNPFA